MFGSQALETAIGLALLFFVLASGASAIVEAISRFLRKRSKDLEATLHGMLTNKVLPNGRKFDPQDLDVFKGTSVYRAAEAAAIRAHRVLDPAKAQPAYLSARAFADAITELLTRDDTRKVLERWPGLQHRLQALVEEAGDDLLHIKAGLEGWFDETMSRLADAYKRWATVVLFFVGLGIAAAGNVSTINVAEALWQQPVLRQAVANAATTTLATGVSGADTAAGSPAAANGLDLTVPGLKQIGLPIGWQWWPGLSYWSLVYVAGWIITALLLMLGAPFWFDTLSRLVSLRTTGARPPAAQDDDSSATARRNAQVQTGATPAGALAPPGKDLVDTIRAALATSAVAP